MNCDLCKTTENVSIVGQDCFLCQDCEAKVEASKRGEISEASQQAESIYYPQDSRAY